MYPNRICINPIKTDSWATGKESVIKNPSNLRLI
jgi:hypothetical protein